MSKGRVTVPTDSEYVEGNFAANISKRIYCTRRILRIRIRNVIIIPKAKNMP